DPKHVVAKAGLFPADPAEHHAMRVPRDLKEPRLGLSKPMKVQRGGIGLAMKRFSNPGSQIGPVLRNHSADGRLNLHRRDSVFELIDALLEDRERRKNARASSWALIIPEMIEERPAVEGSRGRQFAARYPVQGCGHFGRRGGGCEKPREALLD